MFRKTVNNSAESRNDDIISFREFHRTNSWYQHHTIVQPWDKWLENLADVKAAPFPIYDPIQRSALLAWERRNGFQLPEGLRNFYLSTDGINLVWYCDDSECVAGQIKACFGNEV